MHTSPQTTPRSPTDASLNDAVEAVLAAALEAEWAKPRQPVAPVLLTLLTGALALCFAVLLTAGAASSSGTHTLPRLPVSAGLQAPDTSVPAAQASADTLPEDLTATF